MKFERQPYHRDTPDAEFLEDLRTVAQEINKETVSISEYNARGRFVHSTLARRFGSWNKALKAAGLGLTREFRYTDEQFFENLQVVWVKLGRQPRLEAPKKPLFTYSGSAYARRFGSYGKALQTFVKFVNSEEALLEIPETPATMPNGGLQRRTKRGISWRFRFVVMRRDRFCCRICGASPAHRPGVQLHVDHIHPWSKGGETILENLQTLCLKCNIGKSDLAFEEPQRDVI